MTYQKALEFISKQGRFAMKLGTERTRALLDRLGAPDRRLRGVLIAGTNGKGSTGACLTAILQAAGHNVGFMPKPHLISYTERIEVNGRAISEEEFVATLEGLIPTLDSVASELGPCSSVTTSKRRDAGPRGRRTVVHLICALGVIHRLR